MKQGLILFLILLVSTSFAQKNAPLSKAIEKQNWKKVFKLISKEINGVKLPREKYDEVFDSLITNFKSLDCITDAEWSKCGAKILIFPGQETIALKFNSTQGEIEKTFLLHTTKYRTHIRLLGLNLRIPKIERKELVCLLMRNSESNSMINSMRNTCT